MSRMDAAFSPILLGVNVDHIATLRQARRGRDPDPLHAALVCEQAGADGITMHLREDRRHIQDRDVELVAERCQTRLNLEMAITDEMLAIAERLRPAEACLVPERREELTTEGGLDVAADPQRVGAAVARLAAAGVRSSLFVDADLRQVEAAVAAQAPMIELNTGRYCEARSYAERAQALAKLAEATQRAQALGLKVNAGHGLNYHNVQPVAAIPGLHELNIGHAIVCHALYVGLFEAVREMKRLMREAAA